jgi:hypothetical protein
VKNYQYAEVELNKFEKAKRKMERLSIKETEEYC